jgi:RNA-binding protein YlmH
MEDKLLFAKALDRFNSAQKKGAAFTDFLDPVSCEKIFLAYEKKIFVKKFGGYENAERKMIGFFASDDEKNFPITPVAFTYNMKFSKPPTHRDYLGAVIGLGLDRVKIGDILVSDEGATMYVSSDVAAFICENLQQVKRTAVKGKIGEALHSPAESGKEKRITVASMRLDAVISAAFNLSRTKAAALIEGEKVFVNWKLAKKTQHIAEGDAITIRGVGRVAVDEQMGSTKKDRIILRVIVK